MACRGHERERESERAQGRERAQGERMHSRRLSILFSMFLQRFKKFILSAVNASTALVVKTILTTATTTTNN